MSNQMNNEMEIQEFEKRINYIVGQAVASLSFEGLMTTPEEEEELKDMARRVARGEITWEQYEEKVLEECKAYAG